MSQFATRSTTPLGSPHSVASPYSNLTQAEEYAQSAFWQICHQVAFQQAVELGGLENFTVAFGYDRSVSTIVFDESWQSWNRTQPDGPVLNSLTEWWTCDTTDGSWGGPQLDQTGPTTNWAYPASSGDPSPYSNATRAYESLGLVGLGGFAFLACLAIATRHEGTRASRGTGDFDRERSPPPDG